MLQHIRGSRYLSSNFLIPLSTLLILAFLSWVLIQFVLGSTPFAQDSNTPDNGQALAQRIATVTLTEEEVTQASGMYAPGRGIFVYTLVQTEENIGLSNWVRQQLAPFYGTLAEQLPAGEEIHWYVVNAQTQTQAVIIVPSQRVEDLAYYELAQAPNALPILTDIVLESPTTTAAEPPTNTEPTAEISAPTAEPTIQAQSEPENSRLYLDDFTDNVANWALLAGNWEQGDGTYSQDNLADFDQISVFNIDPITVYTATVSFYMQEATIGPGFVYQLAETDNRVGAYLVDLDRSNSVLRFGRYESNGTYEAITTTPLDTALELKEWYTLQMVVTPQETVVFLDNVEIGRQELDNRSGYLGLVTSLAAVEFDDFQLDLGEEE